MFIFPLLHESHPSLHLTESAAPPTEFFPAQASEPLFAPLEASATDCATYEVFVPTTEQYPPSQKQEVEVISSTTMGDL